ncbi:hypothetical protein F5884DRAFT_485173 [Xylogone sp. PMI_703]|nr:hypothetical protein F5884DRAFT_485173 [Xylogone sp. PMI_703]
MEVDKQSSLLSTHISSDSDLHVALHPLVLLSISDYITRHSLRQQEGPVVGALLGQQTSRGITIEHAFECLLEGKAPDGIVLHQDWFEERLKQMKDVHKAPPLDLVGWYTIIPTSGPQPVHLPIHLQILEKYNENAVLLGFHPSEVLDGSSGGKLPITIYDSNYEAEETAKESGEDKVMNTEEPKGGLRFRELSYTIETGEAEMIGMDFVARGGGNATAIEAIKSKPDEASAKGKQGEGKDTKADDSNILEPEVEELIASLQSKANAIKMLKARIDLIAAYLQSVPQQTPETDDANKSPPVNHSMLRSIQALLSRLSLIIPPNSKGFDQELVSEQNDVALVSLLSTVTESIHEVTMVGKKFQVIQHGKQSRRENPIPRGAMWDAPGDERLPSVGDLMA